MKAGEKQRTPRKPPAKIVPLLGELTIMTCPACGAEIDLWSGGDETRCDVCDQQIYKKQRVDH